MDRESRKSLTGEKYTIRDLIDLERLRRVFEKFSRATGFTIGFVEHPSQEILIASGWYDVCTKFHRVHPDSAAKCVASNVRLTGQLKEVGQVVIEECAHGLVDCATPIIINGRHLASLATGQVLRGEADVGRFRRQAKEYDYDVEAYLEALRQVPVVSGEKLAQVMSYLGELAVFIADLGLLNLESRERSSALEGEVSHRKWVESALRESEKRFRSLVETTSDWVWRVDSEGVYTYASSKVKELLGYEPGEIVGKREFGVVGAMGVEADILAARKPFAGLERSGIRKDGRAVVVETSGAPVFDEEGRFSGYLGFDRDVTDRVEAQNRLKEAEGKYRAIFHDAIMGVFRSTREGRILSANNALARTFGFASAEELIGSVVDLGEERYVNGGDRMSLLEVCGRDGVAERFEVELYRKDGKKVWVSLNARAVRDESGEIVFLEGTTEDITERKRTEEALRESERLDRLLAENATDMISRHARDGRALYVTPSSEAVLGYLPEEMVGEFPEKFVPAEDMKRVRELMRVASRRGDGRYVVEHRMRRKDGAEIWAETVGRLVRDGSGTVQEIDCSSRDITGRKHMEAELLRKRTLESIGTLAGGIAHDFNNLLMAVTGYIAIAKIALPSGSEEFGFLAEAERISLAGKELTRKLITFSEGGAPVRRVLEVGGVVRGSAQLAVRGSNVECLFALADDLAAIEADETQIGQVIGNVVLNAMEAMPEGGAVVVRAQNVVEKGSSGLGGEKFVRISIEDRGRGIRGEDLPKIFDPYFTTKGLGAERGMGLGLAVAYSTVERHKGRMEVESAVGIGTTVHIYLPAYKESVERFEGAESGVKAQKKVLFMDDDENVRKVASRLISHLGYEVVVSGNGEEAVAAYGEALSRGRGFDAVILDLTVKRGMGGKEAFDRMRVLDGRVRGVISSGYADDPVIARHREYGFRGAITKPYKVEELKELLKSIME